MQRFKSDPDYSNVRYRRAMSILPELGGGVHNGVMDAGALNRFLEQFWGTKLPDDWTRRYWAAMNAANTLTNGVTLDDFFDFWIHFDLLAFDIYEHDLDKIASAGSMPTPY